MIPKKTMITLLTLALLSMALIRVNGASIDKARITTSDYGDKRVYAIIINTITLEDIEKMNNLSYLADTGSIALMNIRGAKGYDGFQGYLTINASSRAYANNSSAEFFIINNENKEIYHNRVGQDLADLGIINLNIMELLKNNKNMDYSPYIGALGDSIHENGYKTAVFGNSDTADSFGRESCLIAMDSNGYIDYGNIDDIVINDKTFIGNIRTDYDKIINEVKKTEKKANLIVVDTGDLNRLNENKKYLSEEMYLYHRNIALKYIDNFIGNLIDEIDDRESMVMIISPNGQEYFEDKSRLSPLIIWQGNKNKGLLTSGTTRRKGIVSNIDIAPTISSYLGASSDSFLGYPMTIKYLEDNYEYIKNLNNKTILISEIRPKALKIFSYITIFMVTILTIILWIFAKHKDLEGILFNTIINILRILLLLVLVIPLVFILISIIDVESYFGFILYSILIFVIICLLILTIKEKYRLICISGATLLLLIIDMVTGGSLIKFSVLGYDPIIGARYFGIGNEMVGVLLGVSGVFIGCFLQIFNKHYYILSFLGIILLVTSHPQIGANVGGSIAVFFMITIFIFGVFNYKINLKRIFILLTLLFLGIGIIAIIDGFFNENPTHLGRLLLVILKQNPLYILEIARRKIFMNLRLFGITIWTKVLIITALSMIVLMKNFEKIIIDIFKEHKYIAIGFTSTLVANLVGLMVNDSGIIMASISNIYITISLIYVTIVRINETNILGK
ncbi:hypothetical protein [Sporosalibacterium faouarense]|uniref:hypothetical protein n=1 Tax=Sporosalibacterium faouarense TaxID=516123 RepID=UPI00192BE4BA|nr:hypothetical protein [Sporosalibacterium faouarense]